MKELCFLLAWLVPGGILFLRERKEVRLRRHWESQGYKINAPIFWQRTRNAKKMAAAVYAVILLLLQRFFYYSIRSSEGAVVMTIIFVVIGIIAYENALKLAMKGQEAGQSNSQGALGDLHGGYTKIPGSLIADKQHGSTKMGRAANSDMAEECEGGAQ